MNNFTKRLADTDMVNRLLPRFTRYVQIWTTSDRHVAETPSTPGQWDLARMLVDELKGLGISQVELTEHCYVIARLSATPGYEEAPTIGFMAHMDTASDVSGKDVHPIVTTNYDGSVITLKDGVSLDPAKDEALAKRIGDTIIHTDGTTLLGADDKAGVAEIMAALDYLQAHPEIGHGPLEIVFSPDEETGKGLPEFPLSSFKSTAFYTLDGGPAGELEVECFTAYKIDVLCHGKAIHIGQARGKLANATMMAATYATLLPRSESPEATDGYYGYYCPIEIKGDLEEASLEIYIRDFDQKEIERRLAALELFGKTVEAQFPGGRVEVKPQLQYINMKQKIDEHPKVLELLERAAEKAAVKAYLKPIRGGTDGSRLTQMGIPTPNVYTGGHNYHSRTEWASLSDMVASTRTILELIQLWAKERAGA
ncbi:peptidase T [Gracilinema caldarium]|uniref:peptidase T n=1 Tax=Gracilinema caldarium TaxID=215591 RepID=UPI0026EB3B0A|nr:peptidase T [Gracilinema caldarium]